MTETKDLVAEAKQAQEVLDELVTIPGQMDEHRQRISELANRRTELVMKLLDLGWAQAKVARHMGVTPGVVWEMANGKKKGTKR